ncbi:hypothetical protein A9G36_03535 [Gilliamella sp. Choc6-1]|uniref:hypothetical protein n=1 Tax=unclassified Gilliamella TaxID=2685620 RepID=UPI0004DCDD2D|nr:hypothetical protein [Gilliamella apicola]KFA59156.1 hypothetical protein GAPWKB11_1045 [Gilliamella apicola]OCG32308.1 hypothetical protein A9G33_04070 [Gilliamella apicola]OCG56405.1 hypothetical protein A9G36_03535 [Gilliamella apicola]
MEVKKITLFTVVLTLFGCNNNQLDSKIIINNYITNGQFELAPFSKIIKKQKIEGTYSGIIETIPNGLITFYRLNDKKVYIDFKKDNYMIDSQKNSKYKINFDDKQNILTIEDSFGNNVVKPTYDDQGRIIKIENSVIGGSHYTFVNQLSYENNLMQTNEYQIFNKIDGQQSIPYYLNKKQYFYNSENQLIKTIESSFIAKDGKFNTDDQNQTIPDEQLTCIFDDHNQYGDWTKLYCLTPKKETKRFILRSIEYYQ